MHPDLLADTVVTIHLNDLQRAAANRRRSRAARIVASARSLAPRGARRPAPPIARRSHPA